MERRNNNALLLGTILALGGCSGAAPQAQHLIKTEAVSDIAVTLPSSEPHSQLTIPAVFRQEVANVITSSVHIESPRARGLAIPASFTTRAEPMPAQEQPQSDRQETPANEEEPPSQKEEDPVMPLRLASEPVARSRETMSAHHDESERIIAIYLGILVIGTLSMVIHIIRDCRRIKELHKGLQ